MSKKLVIAIDFDGTIVKDKYPEIGPYRFGSLMVLKWLKRRGHILILNTCRECSKIIGISKYECPLCSAESAMKKEGIYFDYINENCNELKERYQNDCRKIGADLYLDDKGYFPGWWIVPLTVLWLGWRKK